MNDINPYVANCISAIFLNQTVNDGVAHSKNPKKCAYHVTFDLDLDLDDQWKMAYNESSATSVGKDCV